MTDAIDTVPCHTCAELERRLGAANDRVRDLESRGRDYDRIVGVGLELARKLAEAQDERHRFAALLEEALLFGSPRVTRKGELLGFLADLDWTRRVETALAQRGGQEPDATAR
jgi:hypothetical protein